MTVSKSSEKVYNYVWLLKTEEKKHRRDYNIHPRRIILLSMDIRAHKYHPGRPHREREHKKLDVK